MRRIADGHYVSEEFYQRKMKEYADGEEVKASKKIRTESCKVC